MMITGTDKWKQVISLLGWGDVSAAKIWFVGLEEAASWEKGDFRKPEFQCAAEEEGKFIPCSVGENETTGVYTIISKIVTGLQGKTWQDDWWKYRKDRLFQKETEVVQTNLYPLGKRSLTSWPPEYVDWFGFSRNEYYEKMAKDDNVRYELIRRQRKQNRNPLTVCFGKTGWPDFINCFRLSGVPCQKAGEGEPFRIYESTNVVLTPFFWSRGMSNKRIGQLIDILNEKKLNPFSQ